MQTPAFLICCLLKIDLTIMYEVVIMVALVYISVKICHCAVC